jgi:hypothetical protein
LVSKSGGTYPFIAVIAAVIFVIIVRVVRDFERRRE